MGQTPTTTARTRTQGQKQEGKNLSNESQQNNNCWFAINSWTHRSVQQKLSLSHVPQIFPRWERSPITTLISATTTPLLLPVRAFDFQTTSFRFFLTLCTHSVCSQPRVWLTLPCFLSDYCHHHQSHSLITSVSGAAAGMGTAGNSWGRNRRYTVLSAPRLPGLSWFSAAILAACHFISVIQLAALKTPNSQIVWFHQEHWSVPTWLFVYGGSGCIWCGCGGAFLGHQQLNNKFVFLLSACNQTMSHLCVFRGYCFAWTFFFFHSTGFRLVIPGKELALLINNGSVHFKCPSKTWQCDREPACKIPGPRKWSS